MSIINSGKFPKRWCQIMEFIVGKTQSCPNCIASRMQTIHDGNTDEKVYVYTDCHDWDGNTWGSDKINVVWG